MADPIAWGLTYKQGKKLSDLMDGFIDDATEVVEKLGMGLPPRDLVAFTAQSTEDGIQLSFTPPGATYLPEHTASDGKQFACMPAGVLIRYSDTSYPRTPEDGILGYNYKPTGDWVTAAQTCDIVGLTKDTKYYFTAFPYSTEHVYNKNQVAANRAEMTWVGNKGTISVNVQLPAGYTGTLGEYTITLVDQAAEGGENITRTATGVGVTRIGGLVAGKTYKVQLSSTDDLQAPPLSDAITIVGGVNNDVTMTYALLYGTIKVNVTTEPTGMPIGAYTVTLTPNDGSGALTQQGNNSQSVVFSDVKNGVVYTVGLSAINHYTANTNGTVTAVGGQEILHNAQYAFSANLEQSSWSEISAVSKANASGRFYNIGDTKSVSITGIGSFNFILSHIDGATMYFTSKELFPKTAFLSRDKTPKCYVGSKVENYVDGTVYPNLPDDLKNSIQKVSWQFPRINKESTEVRPELDRVYKKCDLWIPSAANLFGPGELDDEYTEVYETWVAFKFLYYINDERRIKKLNGKAEAYSTTSLDTYFYTPPLVGVSNAGTMGMVDHTTPVGVCIGFCI